LVGAETQTQQPADALSASDLAAAMDALSLSRANKTMDEQNSASGFAAPWPVVTISLDASPGELCVMRQPPACASWSCCCRRRRG
jgi:hypothetical protein